MISFAGAGGEERAEQRVRRRGCRLKRHCNHWRFWVILRDGVFAGAAGSPLLAVQLLRRRSCVAGGGRRV